MLPWGDWWWGAAWPGEGSDDLNSAEEFSAVENALDLWAHPPTFRKSFPDLHFFFFFHLRAQIERS